jgi:hypothetical protein
MASGTIYLSSSKAWEGKIFWSSEKNIPGNYSDVYVNASMWKTDGYLTSSNNKTSGTITINGESYDLIEYQQFKDEVCIFEDTIRIDHNNDGTKTVAISLSCKGQSGTSLSGVTLSGSGSAVLDTIYRSGTLSAPSGTLGAKQTLTIDSVSSLTSTITYECGELTGTIVSKTSAKSVEWTPPIALAEANPNGTSVTAKLTLTTYSGDIAVGTHTISVFYNIGSEVSPTFTVDFSDDTGYKDIYGDYLQLRSKLKIKVNPTTKYGATVKSCKITVRDETFTDLEAIASEIDAMGSIQVYVYIQDSRGKTAQEYFYVYFREYSLPSATSLTVKRCNANGTSNDQGEFVQVTYSARATSLDNKNTVAYKLEYKKSTDSAFTVVNLPQFTNVFYLNSETYIFAADTGASYNVQLTVTDAFGSTVKTTLASTAATIMHFKANGKGIGLGKVAEVDNAVDVGWNMQMNSHRIMGLADPVDDGDAVSKKFLEEAIKDVVPDQDGNWTMFDAIWPVGSIYISATSTSPAELFGGEWSQIEDRFLLAAGSTYKFGSTGGEAEHTLTVDEMPEHDHWGVARFSYQAISGTHPSASETSAKSNYLKTDKAGGDEPHNNMPPYLAVNVWMRTG